MQYANVPQGKLEQNRRSVVSPGLLTSLLGVPLPSLPSLASWLFLALFNSFYPLSTLNPRLIHLLLGL